MKKPSGVFLLGKKVRAYYLRKIFDGMVIGETKQTVILLTDRGEKIFPKLKTDFVLIDNGEVKIEGSRLLGRPLERLLRGVRR